MAMAAALAYSARGQKIQCEMYFVVSRSPAYSITRTPIPPKKNKLYRFDARKNIATIGPISCVMS